MTSKPTRRRPSNESAGARVDEVLDAYVRATVARFPPLTPAQRERITALLRPPPDLESRPAA